MVIAAKLLSTAVTVCSDKCATSKHESCHGAVLFTSNTHILGTGANQPGAARCYGCEIPSLHAEAAAIYNAFGSKLTKDVFRQWVLQLKVKDPSKLWKPPKEAEAAQEDVPSCRADHQGWCTRGVEVLPCVS